jgi:hypothetical protein
LLLLKAFSFAIELLIIKSTNAATTVGSEGTFTVRAQFAGDASYGKISDRPTATPNATVTQRKSGCNLSHLSRKHILV